MRARQKMADRAMQAQLLEQVQSDQRRAEEDQAKLDSIKAKPSQILSHLEQLNKERADLQAAPETKDKEIHHEEEHLP
uniref:Uncharacterized protein n=1 Tax=Arundo donax TaxID=35708 RepID=A0A0A9EZ17_ARUDO